MCIQLCKTGLNCSFPWRGHKNDDFDDCGRSVQPEDIAGSRRDSPHVESVAHEAKSVDQDVVIQGREGICSLEGSNPFCGDTS